MNTVEAVEQVLAEPARRATSALEVAVGGGDEADVDLERRWSPPTRSNSPLLQHAQELGLHGRRQLADLVEEERAAVGQLEAPGLLAVGAGEGAALVAEQLALEQRLGQRRAVERDEGAVGARAGVMDRRGRATSLPVPLSPVMSTVVAVAATFCAASMAATNFGIGQ